MHKFQRIFFGKKPRVRKHRKIHFLTMQVSLLPTQQNLHNIGGGHLSDSFTSTNKLINCHSFYPLTFPHCLFSRTLTPCDGGRRLLSWTWARGRCGRQASPLLHLGEMPGIPFPPPFSNQLLRLAFYDEENWWSISTQLSSVKLKLLSARANVYGICIIYIGDILARFLIHFTDYLLVWFKRFKTNVCDRYK